VLHFINIIVSESSYKDRFCLFRKIFTERKPLNFSQTETGRKKAFKNIRSDTMESLFSSLS